MHILPEVSSIFLKEASPLQVVVVVFRSIPRLDYGCLFKSHHLLNLQIVVLSQINIFMFVPFLFFHKTIKKYNKTTFYLERSFLSSETKQSEKKIPKKIPLPTQLTQETMELL